uniref:hypothetical protein n=1 Tax=Anaerococcus mediterraneensis TaxID=1870984 RepID=UPI00093038CB|nr:hypothetical protein [Anaerococcus mediterraneensis]
MNKSNIKTITRYTLWESFFPYFPKKKPAGMPKNYLGRLVLLIWSYVFLGYIYIGVFKGLGAAFVAMGQNHMYFVSFAMVLTLMIFLMYINQILSNFYTKSAIANYQTMPLGQGELFLGKLFGGILSFFDFFIFFGIGLYIYFGISGFDALTLVFGIINFFPTIAIAYTLVALVLLLLKKFTNVNRHAKLVKTIGYIILFAIIGLVYYFSFSGGMSAGMGEPTKPFLEQDRIQDMMASVSNVFFNAKLFGLSLTGPISQRIIYTLIIQALAWALIFISYKLADKYYYEAVFDEHLDTSKKVESKKKDIKLESSSQFKTILKKDLKTLFSNIVFLSGPITMAIIFVVLTLSNGRMIMRDLDPDFFASGYFPLICFGIGFAMGFLIWINGGLGSSALSREGKSFYLIQTLPIDPKSHMLARLSSAVLVGSLVNLIISLAALVFIKIGILNALVLFLGFTIACILASVVSLYFGTFMINTNWTKPQEIQQAGGIKAFLFYFASIIAVALLVVCFVFLLEFTDSMVLAMAIPIVLVLILVGLCFRACLKKYKKGFMDLE